MGPPGAGKGTVARIISELYDIPHITTGDMLREAVAKGNERGEVARDYMERGELVPDQVVNSIVEERLMGIDLDDGFILDGFPRNLSQAEALDDILREKGMGLTLVLNLVVDDETIISRLSLRRSCPRCGAVYHLKNKPPEVDEICDGCGACLVQRSDDREEIVRHRLKVHEEETRPLLERYQEAGLVREMMGDLPIEKIPEVVLRVLA